MARAVFLDRDGTLNEDPGYLGDPALVKLFPGTAQALARLKKEAGFLLIVISNQAGIARGLLTEQNVNAVNARINELLLEEGVSIDRFYYCPFHPEFSSPEDCSCRKPSPEMVLRAAGDLNVDLAGSWMVGDAATDIECGIAAGTRTVMVATGYGSEHVSVLQGKGIMPNFVAASITEASDFILRVTNGEN